jgi:hypothetical protein
VYSNYDLNFIPQIISHKKKKIIIERKSYYAKQKSNIQQGIFEILKKRLDLLYT